MSNNIYFRKLSLFILILVVLISGCALKFPWVSTPEPVKGTPDIANEYVLYAILSSASYHDKSRIQFPVDKLGWQLVDMKGNPAKSPTFTHESLAFDIYESNEGSQKKVIFAYRGSDDNRDWWDTSFNVRCGQCAEARENTYKLLNDRYKNYEVTLTGHSLGGMLALNTSVRANNFGRPLPAIVFDPSPRLFDGLGDNHAPAKRTVIFESEEITSVAREKILHKLYEVVDPQDFIEFDFNFSSGMVAKHSADCLTYYMLKEASAKNPATWKAVYEETKKLNVKSKKKCFIKDGSPSLL